MSSVYADSCTYFDEETLLDLIFNGHIFRFQTIYGSITYIFGFFVSFFLFFFGVALIFTLILFFNIELEYIFVFVLLFLALLLWLKFFLSFVLNFIQTLRSRNDVLIISPNAIRVERKSQIVINEFFKDVQTIDYAISSYSSSVGSFFIFHKKNGQKTKLSKSWEVKGYLSNVELLNLIIRSYFTDYQY